MNGKGEKYTHSRLLRTVAFRNPTIPPAKQVRVAVLGVPLQGNLFIAHIDNIPAGSSEGCWDCRMRERR